MTREEALTVARDHLERLERSGAADNHIRLSAHTARALLSPSEREEKLEAAAKRLLAALRLQDEALEQSDAIDASVCDAHRELERLIFPPLYVIQDAPANGGDS